MEDTEEKLSELETFRRTVFEWLAKETGLDQEILTRGTTLDMERRLGFNRRTAPVCDQLPHRRGWQNYQRERTTHGLEIRNRESAQLRKKLQSLSAR